MTLSGSLFTVVSGSGDEDKTIGGGDDAFNTFFSEPGL